MSSSCWALLTPSPMGSKHRRSGFFTQRCIKRCFNCRSSRWQDKGNSLGRGLVFALDTREISSPGKGRQPCPRGLRLPLPSETAMAVTPTSGGQLLCRCCCKAHDGAPTQTGKSNKLFGMCLNRDSAIRAPEKQEHVTIWALF